jgi:hypothetical protein
LSHDPDGPAKIPPRFRHGFRVPYQDSGWNLPRMERDMRASPIILGLAGAIAVATLATPARADRDDWRGHGHGWHDHDWRRHEWRERRWIGPGWRNGYVYAPPPPVYYAPPPPYFASPPTYYAPPPVYYSPY